MNEIIARIGNHKYEVSIVSNNEILLDGIKYQIELIRLNNNIYKMSINDKQLQMYVKEIETGVYETNISGEDYKIQLQTRLEEKANKLLKKNNSNSNKKVIAPMNGLIVKVNKFSGDNVNVGDSLIILEAMKMENEIKSPSDGIIKSQNCKVGASVERGELLFTIE